MKRLLSVVLGLALVATPAFAKPPTSALRSELRARRLHNLGVLHAYWEAGVFPVNHTTPPQGHFLIDARGTFCAVANLVVKSGHRELILAKAKVNNGLQFGNLRSGPLYDWILTSGFTQEEIARIQVPAPYVQRPVRPIPPQEDPALVAQRKVRRYLRGVEQALREETEKELDLATARLAARPKLARKLSLTALASR